MVDIQIHYVYDYFSFFHILFFFFWLLNWFLKIKPKRMNNNNLTIDLLFLFFSVCLFVFFFFREPIYFVTVWQWRKLLTCCACIYYWNIYIFWGVCNLCSILRLKNKKSKNVQRKQRCLQIWNYPLLLFLLEFPISKSDYITIYNATSSVWNFLFKTGIV